MVPESIRYPGGEFLHTCPVFLIYRVPVIAEIVRAHRWCKGMGQPLSDLYPNGIPAIIAAGIIDIECGFNLAERERLDEIERERERSARAAAAANQNHHGPGR
jgi:hypothetical protein